MAQVGVFKCHIIDFDRRRHFDNMIAVGNVTKNSDFIPCPVLVGKVFRIAIGYYKVFIPVVVIISKQRRPAPFSIINVSSHLTYLTVGNHFPIYKAVVKVKHIPEILMFKTKSGVETVEHIAESSNCLSFFIVIFRKHVECHDIRATVIIYISHVITH